MKYSPNRCIDLEKKTHDEKVDYGYYHIKIVIGIVTVVEP